MRSHSGNNGGHPEPKAAGGFRFGATAGWVLLAIIFVLELAGSLGEWHRANRGGLLPIAMHSLSFLAMVWTALILMAERFSRLLAWLLYSGKTGAFLVLRAAGAAAVSAGWVLLVLGLGMRQALGCYPNPSLLQFAWANMSNGLWAHTARNYRWMLAVVSISLLITTPLVFRKVWRDGTRLNLLGNPKLCRPVLVICLAVASAFTFSTLAINRQESKELRTRTMRHLCYKLEPVMAFCLGCADLYREAYDENRALDQSTLTPLTTAPLPSPSLSDKPNIILFQIESCRPDIIGMVCQGMEVCPNLNRIARQGTRFTKAYAPGTHTSLSNVSIPSSLYPLRRSMLVAYRADDPQPKTLIYDVLKPLGYVTAWISSDFEGWAGMRDFLETPALDVFVDATTQKVRAQPDLINAKSISVQLAPDTGTMAEALHWIDGQLRDKQPFYVTISLSDSHFPYISSLHSNWFQPCGIPDDCSIFDYPQSLRDQVRNTYLNAIHGIDILLGQLLDFLRQKGADGHTIIVIYGDHGESFYENGVLSHANLPYDPSARTTLVMYGKGYFQPRIEDYPTSLVDLVPTVLARLGLPPRPNFQGIDVLSPSRPPVASRCVYIHVDGRINGDGLLAAGRWKYFTDNGSGACYLYDLATDPGEARNLVESEPVLSEALARQLDTFCAGQLVYYHSARYYTRFFPPPPPQIKLPLEQSR
ncbi:MAG: sulfatase-like hydrolase/transferase [Verrucomicrobiota bacterium]|jgi:arylsulfatase A-like enzyme